MKWIVLLLVDRLIGQLTESTSCSTLVAIENYMENQWLRYTISRPMQWRQENSNITSIRLMVCAFNLLLCLCVSVCILSIDACACSMFWFRCWIAIANSFQVFHCRQQNVFSSILSLSQSKRYRWWEMCRKWFSHFYGLKKVRSCPICMSNCSSTHSYCTLNSLTTFRFYSC